jgi:endonuclease YncB( thermonuclease family)
MAKAFNLTAELNLRGPSNLKQIAASIRREIGTVDATVNVKIDRAAERSILNSANALNRLNRELQTTATASASSTNNINNLVASLNSLSNALTGSNNSMQRIVSTSEQTARQMSRIRKTTAVARDEMEEFGRQSALAVRRFAAFNFATGVIYGFYNAISKALGEFTEFDRQLVRLTQITGESYSELSRITETITGLSTGLGVASGDLIRISDTLAQAGLSARETDQALRALALTALAPSFDDLNNTVEGSIALMRQFKIGTDDLAGALGSINAVAAGFAVEAGDIITAIQRTGGVFAAASKGVSEGTDALNEFIAVFTSVRATTRESAETIATGLRTIFTRIQREDTIEALKEYGVNLLDVEGKFVGAYRAVQLLSEGLGKLDPRDVSFSRIVEELGGFRQIGKVLPLIQEFSTAQQALTVAQRGQNSLAADAAKAQSALTVQFTKTRESFVALIRDIGSSDSFKTLISLGLTLANTFIKVADFAKPLLPILTTIAALQGAKSLTSFVGGFVGGLRKVRPGEDGGGGGGPANRARTERSAADITDNSRYLDANTTALMGLGTAMGGLTAVISPLQASIDNLGNAAIAQLNNEIVALNNTMSSIDLGGAATAKDGGRILRFARGGAVPGSGRGDKVPAMLEPGEVVMSNRAVSKYGRGNLVRMNKYAKGGKPKRGVPNQVNTTDVVDGDTIGADIFTNLTFRFSGIDAPEKSEPLGDKATSVLTNKKLSYFNNKITSGVGGKSRGLFKDDALAGQMIRSGLAVPDIRYAKNKFSSDVEAGRAAGQGLWNSSYANHPKRLQFKEQYGYSFGGQIQKFMSGSAGGVKSKPEPFGTGVTKFPRRISNAYAKQTEKEKTDRHFDRLIQNSPINERIMVDEAMEQQISQGMQQPLDREKFAASFRRAVLRDEIASNISNFAKLVGLPQEDLSVVLPRQLDFGSGSGPIGSRGGRDVLGGAFTTISPYGSRGAEGWDLSEFGYTKQDEQDLFGLEKLLEEKKKERDKIRKTPTRTFDDGSFSYDLQAADKASDEYNALNKQIYDIRKKRDTAISAANKAREEEVASSGRATLGFGTRFGKAQNPVFYHELTHQLFKGLRAKSADSFEKYKQRVTTLFETDNDGLADAFDALGAGYSSADVVYGRAYKLDLLGARQREEIRKDPAGEDVKNLSSIIKSGSAAKKATQFRPINPSFNEAMLKFYSQEHLDKVEDNGKEEFLTTLVEKMPVLDQRLQGILDSTMTELLGGAGIQRQQYFDGGWVERMKTQPDDILRRELQMLHSGSFMLSVGERKVLASTFAGLGKYEDIGKRELVARMQAIKDYLDERAINQKTKYAKRRGPGLQATEKYNEQEMLDAVNYYAAGSGPFTKALVSGAKTFKEPRGETYKTKDIKDRLLAASQFTIPKKTYSGLGRSQFREILSDTNTTPKKLATKTDETLRGLVGQTIDFPTFLSVSAQKDQAEAFVQNPGALLSIDGSSTSQKTIDVVKARRKTQIDDSAIKSSRRLKGIENISEKKLDIYEEEQEFIVPPNVGFKITKATGTVYQDLSAKDLKSKSKKALSVFDDIDMFSDPDIDDFDKTRLDIKVNMLRSGGIVQKFMDGGVAQRKLGYIDYDVIANPANEAVVAKGMEATGVSGPRLYTDKLIEMAVKARKEQSLNKLRAIYGVAGAGKTTMARGQGTDKGTLRETTRFPILSPEDIHRANEIILLSSSVSQDKLDTLFADVDRAYTLSSTTSEEKERIKSQRASRDATGVGLEGRTPGSTTGVARDTVVGEALLADRLGDRSVVLGRTESGRLRRKRGDELVEIVKKRIGMTWGGFAPMTAGHESILDAAAAMGISPEDFVFLVGSNESIKLGDPSSYRTAIFNQDARVLLAKAGAGARGATVVPKAADFEVPLGIDISEQEGRRKVLLPGEGSTVFVADKTEQQTAKYREAGYKVSHIERTGGISGTMVRDLIMSGNMAELQKVLSPGVYDLISNNIGRIQNRANVLPDIIEQVKQSQGVKLAEVERAIKAVGISRIDPKKMEDPEYAAKVQVLEELRSQRDKIKRSAAFEPYRLLDKLAASQPEQYALDFSQSQIATPAPVRTVKDRAMAAVAAETSSLTSVSSGDAGIGTGQSLLDNLATRLKALGGESGLKALLKEVGEGIPLNLQKQLRTDQIKRGVLDTARVTGLIEKAEERQRQKKAEREGTRHVAMAGLQPLDYSWDPEWELADGRKYIATIRGFKSSYLQDIQRFRDRQKAAALEFGKDTTATEALDLLGQNTVQGPSRPLAIDFDETLAFGTKMLDSSGQEDISAYYDEARVREVLSKATPTRLAQRLLEIEKDQPGTVRAYTRVLTARAESLKHLVTETLNRFGLPYTDSDITGVGQRGDNDRAIARKKADNLSTIERFIDDNEKNISAAQQKGIQSYRYSEPKAFENASDYEPFGAGNIEGALLEQTLAMKIGRPIDFEALEQNRALDFPNGLGAAASLFGLPPNIETEVKRTLNKDSFTKARSEFNRYFKENPDKYNAGGVAGFADGGTVPALVSNGEAYVPPKLAKKIGYGKLNRMNQADRNGMGRFADGGISVFKGPGSGTSDSIPTSLPVGSFVIRAKATKALGLNRGGSVGVTSPQRFEMGGEVLTAAEMQRLELDMRKVFESLPEQLRDSIRNLDLPDVDTSTWNTIDISLRKVFLSVNRNVDTLGKDVVEAMRAMTTAGQNALQSIDLDRVRTRQSEIASDRGYTQVDKDRMKADVSLAKDARGAVSDRKRKNRERQEQGKAPFPMLDLMEMMRSSVGRSPDPISVTAATPVPEVQSPSRDAEYYRQRMNYSDVSGNKNTPISDRGMAYAGELTKQDDSKVDALVKQMRDMFSSAMAGIGQTPSAAGQSESWATWDIGKQLFMNQNPDQSSDKYQLGNPMQDPKLVLQMVQRMVGYEVSGGGQREGKANNIPSFELVEIGAKAMAESLGKNQAALDAFLSLVSGITVDDIVGPASPGAPTSPTPPTAPIPPTPPTPPSGGSPPSGGGSPPVPPSSPPSGDTEAMIQRYMMELETAAKATKLQTYQTERLAGATASEAKARADAAAFAAYQALAQQRLTTATTEEASAINEARSRMAATRGGATVTAQEFTPVAQSLSRGGAPAPDTTDYRKLAQDNIQALQEMNTSALAWAGGSVLAIKGLSGLVGSSTALGSALDGVSNSVGNTQALFLGFNKVLRFASEIGVSEEASKKIEDFSAKLIDAGRMVNNWAAKLPDGLFKNLASKLGGGIDLGGGQLGKLGAKLPQVISSVTSSLTAIMPTAQLVVGGLNAAAQAFIAYTDAIRNNKVENATKALDTSLKNASSALDLYNKNTVDNANQLSVMNAEIGRAAAAAKTLADIDKTNQKWSTTNLIGETLAMGGGGAESRAQRAEILDKKGTMAYVGSLLDFTGGTQQRYSQELAPQQAIKSSEQFAKVATLIQQQNQARFKAGESSSDIMNSPEWAQQAEVIARANAATEERLRLIDADISLSKSAREARKQELIQFAAAGAVRSQEIQAIRQANNDRANQESGALLYSLERMLNNMEQSISSVTYSLSKLADQTDLLRSSMTGEAKIGSSRVDAINVLQNPNVSSDVERAQASKTASQFFGAQGKDIEGLLNFGPKLEETILSSINRTVKEDPNAGSGKIEARISQNLEKELGKLNIDAGLRQVVSKQMAGSITDSRTKGDDKTDFKTLFSETAAFGKIVQSTKRAQEAAVKALEFYQQSVNNYAQSMNEMVSLQISSNEKFRRASDIRARGELDLAKTLGKSVSFEKSKQVAQAGVISQAGTADPTAIFNNIGRLEQVRQSQQGALNSAVQGGPRNQKDIIAFNRELASTTMGLRENYAALKGLAESTEVAQAAMTKIGELKAKNEAGLNILERFVTSSPKDQAKLSGAFERLDRNMNGQINNMWDSARVQEAYNEALQSGASMQEAQDAADSAAAQDRGDTLEAFRMLAPMLGENQNELKANMLESMMRESGTETSPMFSKVIEGLRNPEQDPQMAEAINQYKQAIELQSQANRYLAMLDGRLAIDIGQQSQAAFTNALNGVGQAFANTNTADMAKGIQQLNDHLRGGVTKVTNVGGGGALPFARGGKVEYRAVGGSIFQPKGTDTVPAMLTPGEFVVNKRAASANKGILTAINNGYSKGGSVKYLAEGGWVSDMLTPETDRFGDAKPGELYTKWDDFSKFASGNDVKANIEKIKANSKDIYFYKPHSYPTFSARETESSELLSQLKSGMDGDNSFFGFLPDFSMSLLNTAGNIIGATAQGVGTGAVGGAAMAANPAQFVSATAAGNFSQGQNTAGALLGNGKLGTAASWIWEAMKFVPGLGGVVSGIDAFKKLVFDYDLIGGALEAVNAVFSLIPFPGAGLLGKGISKGLGWMMKIFGKGRVATMGKTWIPKLIEATGATRLMNTVKGWLGQGPANLVEKLLPDVVKKKLGLNLAGAGKSGATLAREGIEQMSPDVLDAYKAYRKAGMAADEALARAKGRLNYVGSSTSGMQASAAQAAARNASDAGLAGRATINDMAARAVTGSAYGAGAMGTAAAGTAYMQGRTPSATMSGADKLKSITEALGFKIPDQFRSPETTSKIFDENLDNLALSEAQMQLSAVEMWIKAIDEANKWSETNKPPKAKASYSNGSYNFTSEPVNKKEYMYATIGEALSTDAIMGDLKPNIIKFYKSGNPTLSNSPDTNQISAAAESFIKSQGRDFDQLLSTDNYNRFQDINSIKDYLQDYYDSLREINTATTTPEKYNSAHWSPAQPSKQKEGRISSILGSLQAGTRYSYDFKKSELAKVSDFQWGSSAPAPAKDGEKPAESKDTGDVLTVYGTEMRAIWSNIRDAEDETIKEAIKNKNIWDGKAENAFRIYKQGSSPDQYDPLPWTTNPSLITAGMRQLAQQSTEDNIASTIGLKMGTVSRFDKVIDLPKAKRELPVSFSYQPFQQIPLLDPATTDIDSAVNQFLPGATSTEPSPTPVPGVFIKYRATEAADPTLSPFSSMAPGADKLMPYYSSVANMEKAVNDWALGNFDRVADWSLLGVSLASGYSPIKAEAAMKSAESIRGARTKRKSKEGSVPDKESSINSATEYLFKKDALFYKDDFLSAVEPSYPEAGNIAGAKIPNLVDIMQRRAARQIAGNKDAKKAEISAKASLVNFKSEEVPLLGDIVWQKIKESSLAAGPALSSAADWQNAATADGVPPPAKISGQDDLMAAVDYIAWIQAKVLRLRDKATEQNNRESVENLGSEAEFGKYMSAGRFLSQLASDSERPVTASTTIGQASERLYSKYMNENKLDKYIKKSAFKDKDSGKDIEQQFWDVPKIINEDKSFVDYILGFANQTRTAQRFRQAVTGNGRAELGGEQKALLQGQFKAFGQSKSATAMMGSGAKDAAQTTMKVASADGIEEIAIPTEIDNVIDQFLDTSKVYEPLYRETLGKILETNGRTYAEKWTKSGDPGTAGWASIWGEYSEQLTALTDFLVNRDRLLMRPIATEGSSLYPPAVLPSISESLLPTLQSVAQVSGIKPPEDVTAETLLGAINDRALMMEQIKRFMASVSPTAPEDYEKRDQMKKIAKQAMDFYENNLSPSSLPRVFTQEGNEIWNKLRENYKAANEAYMGFAADGSDVSVGLGSLEDIYNPSQMPYAQNTLYGLYYRLNKQAGTNNTVEALMNEKAAKDKAAAAGATPKPETQTQDVPAQAAAAAPKEPEPGIPPEPTREEAERKVQARAKGGLIYRADGGAAPVNWSPRGTDTVPAMLTPGEFVINRGATQKYLPILEAINNGSTTAGQIVTYANRGGVIKPKYFQVGGSVEGASSGVSTSYSMGFDSATLAAIKQFDSSVQSLGDALSGLQLGNIKIDEAALSALGDFATRFDQFTQSLLKLNVPPVISITGQHEVNVNINGTSVFNNMEEKMKQLISQEVDKAFTQLSKETEGNITMNYKPPQSPMG